MKLDPTQKGRQNTLTFDATELQIAPCKVCATAFNSSRPSDAYMYMRR